MSAEEDLQTIANGQRWDLPNAGTTVEALRNLQAILANVASDTGITGTAGMSASETLDQTKKDIDVLIDYIENTLPPAITAANNARETAKTELAKLNAGQLDSGQVAAIRAAEVGATVFLGPFSIVAGEGAIAIANSILGNQRNEQAEASLDTVNAELKEAHAQIKPPPYQAYDSHKSDPSQPQVPETHEWVDPTPSRRSGGGGSSWAGGNVYVPGPGDPGPTGYPGDPGTPSGPGYVVMPNPDGSGGPLIVPTPDGPISGGTGLPGGPGGGIHVPGGSGGGSGLLGGSGGIGSGLIAGAGGGAALGGLGKLAGAGGAGALGRLGGGGGLGAGAGSTGAGAAGRSGGLLGGTAGSGTAAGAASEGAAGRGAAGMAGGGMGGQGGAGGKNDKRGRGLGGPLAPKLEDDEEIGPWSENAGAGGRD